MESISYQPEFIVLGDPLGSGFGELSASLSFAVLCYQMINLTSRGFLLRGGRKQHSLPMIY